MKRFKVILCLYCRKPFRWQRAGDHYNATNPDGSLHYCPERETEERTVKDGPASCEGTQFGADLARPARV
jgi:hypothetical protein